MISSQAAWSPSLARRRRLVTLNTAVGVQRVVIVIGIAALSGRSKLRGVVTALRSDPEGAGSTNDPTGVPGWVAGSSALRSRLGQLQRRGSGDWGRGVDRFRYGSETVKLENRH